MQQQAARHDQFVSGLLHQIRLLELEVAYLKKGGQMAHRTEGVHNAAEAAAAAEGEGEARGELPILMKQGTPTPTAAAPLTERLREEMHSLRSELGAKSQRLESLSAENMQLQVGQGNSFLIRTPFSLESVDMLCPYFTCTGRIRIKLRKWKYSECCFGR